MKRLLLFFGIFEKVFSSCANHFILGYILDFAWKHLKLFKETLKKYFKTCRFFVKSLISFKNIIVCFEIFTWKHLNPTENSKLATLSRFLQNVSRNPRIHINNFEVKRRKWGRQPSWKDQRCRNGQRSRYKDPSGHDRHWKQDQHLASIKEHPKQRLVFSNEFWNWRFCRTQCEKLGIFLLLRFSECSKLTDAKSKILPLLLL